MKNYTGWILVALIVTSVAWAFGAEAFREEPGPAWRKAKQYLELLEEAFEPAVIIAPAGCTDVDGVTWLAWDPRPVDYLNQSGLNATTGSECIGLAFPFDIGSACDSGRDCYDACGPICRHGGHGDVIRELDDADGPVYPEQNGCSLCAPRCDDGAYCLIRCCPQDDPPGQIELPGAPR